jgi:hypothetical protein
LSALLNMITPIHIIIVTVVWCVARRIHTRRCVMDA